MLPLSIPSPPTSVWYVGSFPIRAYALAIMIGIVVAAVIAHRRWKSVGGNPETLETALVVAVPLGIVGARIYHVITDHQLYFGPGRNPIRALYIWEGGLGIWGAVALGALGVWLVCRRRGAKFLALADAMAPGLVIAQGIGRLGNWFNQELFGRPTTLPWALQIDPAHRPEGFGQFATFHPTFLYELLWNFGVAAALLWAERRFRLGRGKVFALYVVLYTAGRFWIEALRIDTVNEIGGFRLNNYTAIITFTLALVWFIWLCRHRPGRDTVVDASVAEDRDASVAEDRDASVAEDRDASVAEDRDASVAEDSDASVAVEADVAVAGDTDDGAGEPDPVREGRPPSRP